MNRQDQLLLFIKRELSVKGTTLEDVLHEIDRGHTGFVPIDAVNRAFANYNIRVSFQDFQDLMSYFSDGRTVNCRLLLASLRSLQTTNSDFRASSPRKKPENALSQLAKYLVVRQVPLRELLRPFDRTGSGKISVNDFCRAVDAATNGREIVAAYCDDDSQLINYLDVERDLMEISEEKKAQQNVLHPPVVDTVINQLAARNVPIRQIFERFDREKRGIVLHRALPDIFDRAGLRLNANDIKELIGFYCKQYHNPNQFAYEALCRCVEDKIYDRMDDQKTAFRNQNGELVDTNQVIERLREIFFGRRVNVAELFPYAQNGKCPRFKFIASLNNSIQRQLSGDELNSIADRFDIGNGEIDLQSFLQFFNFNRNNAGFNMNSTYVSGYGGNYGGQRIPSVNVDAVLEYVKKSLSARRVCLQKQCELYDHRRSGTIATAQLMAAFQTCAIQFAGGEFEAICNRFSVDEGIIDYISLSNVVDDKSLYNPVHYNRHYLDELNNSGPFQKLPLEDKPPRQALKQAPPNVMKAVAKIAIITRNLEIFLRDEFSSRDRTKRGYVTHDDFTKVIGMCNFKFSQFEIAEILNYYMDHEGKFDYLSFCQDVERCNADNYARGRYVGDGESVLGNLSEETPEFKAAILKYRALLASKMITTDDIFRKADPNGTGHIPVENLASTLNFSNIGMSKNEMDQLIKYFSDPIIEGRFLYRKLDARAMKEKVNISEIRELLNPEYAMEEEIRQLHSVLTEIREKLHARRKNAYMLYSKLPPTIPPQQFSDILLDSGIILEKPQIVALIKKYTNGDMRNFVWQSFCDDCERCTLIGGRY